MAAAGKASALTRLSTPAKVVFTLVLALVVAALYFVVFYADLDGQIAQEDSRAQSLAGDLQRAQEAKEAYQKDLEEKTRKQQLVREQKKILPDEAETPAFLAALQGVATVSGIQLTSYKPEDEVADQYYVRVPMSLSLSGRFHQVARFFFGVGQLDRVINIEEIDMKLRTEKRAEGAEVILDVKCLATAFRALKQGESGVARTGRGRAK